MVWPEPVPFHQSIQTQRRTARVNVVGNSPWNPHHVRIRATGNQCLEAIDVARLVERRDDVDPEIRVVLLEVQ